MTTFFAIIQILLQFAAVFYLRRIWRYKQGSPSKKAPGSMIK